MSPFTLSVSVRLGLESVCAGELRRLDFADVHAENGRVLCRCGAHGIARANLNLRTGERVLLRLGRFDAPDFDALYQGVRALPWAGFIPRNGAFPVRGRCLDSVLTSEQRCAAIIRAAVGDALGAQYALERLSESGAAYQIRFFNFKNVIELYLDSSGEGLHKRGYRAKGVSAPLRETLAAGMVLLSRYRGRGPFRDPFCGSGTIPIEAALIAKNRAPGLERHFAAQKWAWLDSGVWLDEADRAMDLEREGSWDIAGGDIDPAAVELSRENAIKAGVEDLIQFTRRDAGAFHPEIPGGTVVTNPPYGERLADRQEAQRLYARFGRAWRQVPEGWSLYILSSHTEFERAFGLPADKKRKLYNGMLKCDLFQYLARRK